MNPKVLSGVSFGLGAALALGVVTLYEGKAPTRVAVQTSVPTTAFAWANGGKVDENSAKVGFRGSRECAMCKDEDGLPTWHYRGQPIRDPRPIVSPVSFQDEELILTPESFLQETLDFIRNVSQRDPQGDGRACARLTSAGVDDSVQPCPRHLQTPAR
jgi:hypothetical protein